MTFFFDVWTNEGFILMEDVRLSEEIGGNTSVTYLHKIRISKNQLRGPVCAIAVAGEDPEASLDWFSDATRLEYTLRGVAKRFAHNWTDHFIDSGKYSAAHIVGYERYQDLEEPVPQMWYWSTIAQEEAYLLGSVLRSHLSTFDPNETGLPFNCHIPSKIREGNPHADITSPPKELLAVKNYISENGPIFTWNGDTRFWRSAGSSVAAAFDALRDEQTTWSLDLVKSMASECIRFIERLSRLRTESTIGTSPGGEFDICVVKPSGTVCHMASFV